MLGHQVLCLIMQRPLEGMREPFCLSGKVLYLTTILPSRKQQGGEVASQAFIDALRSAGLRVIVLGFCRKGENYQPGTDEIVVDERYGETSRSKGQSAIWLVTSLLKGLPYSTTKFFAPAYVRVLKKMYVGAYSLVVVDHAQMAWLLPYLPHAAKIVFVAHNVEEELYDKLAVATHPGLVRLMYQREARLLGHLERRLATSAIETWSLSEHDRDCFAAIGSCRPPRVFGMYSSVTPPSEPPPPPKCDVCMLGLWTWQPNRLGLVWFFKEVYPRLAKDLRISVAGRGAEWLAGRYANVAYCGFVPEAQEFLQTARVIAIPLLTGGGVQIKTLDAIASGNAVVATSVAMRGLAHFPATVSVADDPDTFVQYISTAVHAVPDQRSRQEAIEWSRQRREVFEAAVVSAAEGLMQP